MDRGGERDRRLAALMQAAQDGNASAYAELLREITELLRRAIRHRRPYLSPQDVEDLVQDVLLSVHAARATYDPERPFLPWLMAIARNRGADGARRHARSGAGNVPLEDADETFLAVEPNMSTEGYGDPEALRLAVRALPRVQRQAIEMLKLREMSLKEAAAASGMSIAALKVAVHRGMHALRKALS
jgi:RNA polymerase sigma-70 factor (ECF subfamily)